MISSAEMKQQPAKFWKQAIGYTFLSWTARYFVVNAILAAFFSVSDHVLIFARQLFLWIIMLISPSPGGSGFAEVIMGRYISDLIPADPLHVSGIAFGIAVIWRIITYYPFLIAGVLVAPAWIERKFIRRQTK